MIFRHEETGEEVTFVKGVIWSEVISWTSTVGTEVSETLNRESTSTHEIHWTGGIEVGQTTVQFGFLKDSSVTGASRVLKFMLREAFLQATCSEAAFWMGTVEIELMMNEFGFSEDNFETEDFGNLKWTFRAFLLCLIRADVSFWTGGDKIGLRMMWFIWSGLPITLHSSSVHSHSLLNSARSPSSLFLRNSSRSASNFHCFSLPLCIEWSLEGSFCISSIISFPFFSIHLWCSASASDSAMIS